MLSEAQKTQGRDSPGASFNLSSQEKRIQLCSDKIHASAWDSNGVKFIANQAVRQVPQYSLPSHSRLSTLSLLQEALPFPPPAEVIKGVPTMPARTCHHHPVPSKKLLGPSAEFHGWAERRSMGKELPGSLVLSPRAGIWST